MAQHDYDIANQTFPNTRADINAGFAAAVTNNSGATAPSTTFAYMWWADTTTGLLKQRNAANSGWITIGTLASANLGHASLASPAFTGTPTAPTASADTATAQIASTEFMILQSASQGEMETATSTTKFTSPGRAHFHPGMAKAWCVFNYVAGVPTILASYNVSSITDNGTGDAILNMGGLSSTNYCVVGSVEDGGWGVSTTHSSAFAARLRFYNTSNTLADPTGKCHMVIYGDA